MLLYIHGFGNQPPYKAQALIQRGRQRGISVICPNLPDAPQLAVQTCATGLSKHNPRLVGKLGAITLVT